MKLDLTTPRFAQAPADAGTGGTGADDAAKAAAAAAAGGADAAKAAEAAKAADAAKAAAGTDGAGARKSALTAGAADKDGAKGAMNTDAGADAAAKAKADGADTPLEVKLPEGTVVDKGLLDAFAQQAKTAGMNGDQASKLATWWAGVEKTRAQDWAKQSDSWFDELGKDQAFGGKNLDENIAAFQCAVKKFGEPYGLAKDLEKFGIDNMPSLVRTFAAIGKALGEQKGAIVETRTAPKLTPEQERVAKRYPSHAQKA